MKKQKVLFFFAILSLGAMSLQSCNNAGKKSDKATTEQSVDAKCGEGKCGDAQAATETKCGDAKEAATDSLKAKSEAKCGTAKAEEENTSETKCGDAK